MHALLIQKGQAAMRTLTELINASDPGIALIRDWIVAARCPVEILTCSRDAGEAALIAIQVTTRSPLGAICHETGGILVDDGWLRILGAGHPRLPRSMPGWNQNKFPVATEGKPSALLVADDVIGGFYALNGGAIDGIAPGNIAYLAPDTLAWEDTGLGYSEFLCWSWSGKLDACHADQRWSGWRDEVRTLHGDQVLMVYPFLWMKGPPIGDRLRKPIPVAEAFSLAVDLRRQLASGGDGESSKP
jgi:hypothetical protein